MNHDAYMKFHQELCERARELSARKNRDYAAPDARKGDPFAVFANFLQAERLNICTTEQGFLVRLSDKLSRLANLTREGHERGVMDESIQDTILDMINYSVLFAGYLVAKEAQAQKDRKELERFGTRTNEV